jgi:hypothetical protein
MSSSLLHQMRTDRSIFLDLLLLAGQHLEQSVHVGLLDGVVPGAIHANNNLSGHRFSSLSARRNPMLAKSLLWAGIGLRVYKHTPLVI